MKIAVNQPNYIPWLPFFNLISKVDKFFILDNVNLGTRTYINRSKIYLKTGTAHWLTVPISEELKRKKLNEIKIDKNFKIKHLRSILMNLTSKSAHLKKFLEKIIVNDIDILSKYNFNIIQEICKFIKLDCEFVYVSEYIKSKSFDRAGDIIQHIIKSENCSEYYNFQKGVEIGLFPYNDENFFKENNIRLFKQNLNKFIVNENHIEKFSLINYIDYSFHKYKTNEAIYNINNNIKNHKDIFYEKIF